ncbi:alpha/beta hydrolase [Thalassobacillus hwangdonensis]
MKKMEAESPGVGVIVIVHGAFEHAGRYDETARFFQEHGYHVIYGDLPAHGDCSGKRGHIQKFDEYIESVGGWLDEAFAYELPVFLLGHSMGGLITVRVMEELQPDVTGVILSSPALGIFGKPSIALRPFVAIGDRFSPEIRVKAPLKMDAVTRNKAIIDRDENDPKMLKRISIRWYTEFERAIEASFENISRFPDVPTLVMQAGDDKMVKVSSTEKWYEQLRVNEKSYKKWESLYHEIFNEPERQEVLEHTLDFLKHHTNK